MTRKARSRVVEVPFVAKRGRHPRGRVSGPLSAGPVSPGPIEGRDRWGHEGHGAGKAAGTMGGEWWSSETGPDGRGLARGNRGDEG